MTSSTWDLLTNPNDPRHGTEGGYSNHGCRCTPCTEANRAAQAEDRQRRRGGDIPDYVHGTTNGYSNYCCRCDECREAHNAAARARRALK